MKRRTGLDRTGGMDYQQLITPRKKESNKNVPIMSVLLLFVWILTHYIISSSKLKCGRGRWMHVLMWFNVWCVSEIRLKCL
jgi:hypothetical protein